MRKAFVLVTIISAATATTALANMAPYPRPKPPETAPKPPETKPAPETLPSAPKDKPNAPAVMIGLTAAAVLGAGGLLLLRRSNGAR